MKAQSFRRADKVTNKSRYRIIYEQGVRRGSRFFTIVACGNPNGAKRLGITVTKKTGNAVFRNRTKRLIREFFRRNKDLFPAGHDVVVMAKKSLPPLTYQETEQELTELFNRKTGR
ncbi:MAG: ribonuclease P protein component [Deltaproteobacteria bacterium]